MTETVLVAVIAILSGLIGWMDWNNRKERKSLVNTIVARSSDELVNLELADKTKVEVNPPKTAEDLVPLGDISDDEFDEHVLGKE
jgi:hypothetical protein